MIHVLLDTSSFRGSKPEQRTALYRAARRGALMLHVPEVVEREYASQLEQDAMEKYDGARAALNKIVRHFRHTSEAESLHEYLRHVMNELVTVKDEFAAFAANEFANTLDQVHAKRYPIEPEDGKAVMDRYFKGDPPFLSPKNRCDIPDAFIREAILRAIPTDGKLYVVCNDTKGDNKKGLLKALSQIDGVVHVHTLLDFFGRDEISSIMQHFRDSEIIRNWLEEHRATLESEVSSELNNSVGPEIFVGRRGLQHFGSMVNAEHDWKAEIRPHTLRDYEGMFDYEFSAKTVMDIEYRRLNNGIAEDTIDTFQVEVSGRVTAGIEDYEPEKLDAGPEEIDELLKQATSVTTLMHSNAVAVRTVHPTNEGDTV